MHTYVILLYIISIVTVCFLFPREGKFPYEYQKGKIWGHDELYAPFDIPILKTQQELDVEKDSLLRAFVMYCNEHSEVAEQQKKRFNQAFDEQWKNSGLHEGKNRLHQSIVALLDSVYGRGILQADDGSGSQSLSDQVVIIKNNIAGEGDLDDILTPKAAYELVMNSLEKEDNNEEMLFVKSLNLNNFIQPNLVFNDDITNKAKTEQVSKVSYTKGVVPANRKIIARGEVVNDEKFNILVSMQHEFENRVGDSGKFKQIWTGQAIIVLFCFLLVYIYLMYFRPEIFRNTLRTAFLLLIMVLFISLSCIVVRKDYFSLYLLPYVLIPVIICTFYDARTANFIYTVTLLVVGFIAPNGFEFVFLNFVAGIVGIINVKSIYRRGSLFKSILVVILAYCVAYSAMVLMQGSTIRQIDWMNYVRFAISGSLIFVAYPSIFIFEKTFGFISDITLMELSDTNQPLLRKLSEVAPGTFQHSLQVANLSEEVIQKIGGNPLLIRTGALYHDIGKINRPSYFIENQTGSRNPHEDLSPENSAQIIIEHVSNGVEIARKNRIPLHVIDFIRTHHGNTTVRFFYHLQQKQQSDKRIDRSKFTYPGPIPFSKEMVVLMMCDSIEAASRSLKEMNHRNISDLVDNIVNYQVLEDQYNDANITYREINTAKHIIKNRLMNIYHVRIEYPKT
jgi:putative nucleotidyltransferase with HDIG domain